MTIIVREEAPSMMRKAAPSIMRCDVSRPAMTSNSLKDKIKLVYIRKDESVKNKGVSVLLFFFFLIHTLCIGVRMGGLMALS